MENFGRLGKNKLYRPMTYDVFSQRTGQVVTLSHDKFETTVLNHFFQGRIETVA